MKRKNYFLPVAFALAVIAGSFSCGKSDPAYVGGTGGGATGNEVKIRGMSFSPASITVDKGEKVKWKNEDGSPHTVTSNDGTSFDSDNIGAGASWTYTANTPGTFEYHCAIHGMSMSGTLIVKP